MVAWPEPIDGDVDDRRRRATHRLICFQSGDEGALWAEPDAARSWCALFPLSSGPHTRAEELLRLENDRATLLDLDQRAPVNAEQHPDGHWEVRPLEGPGLLVGTSGRRWRPGYAEAAGLLPLIVPRPGRPVSPYATALGNRDWSISKSIDSVDTWSRRSTRMLRRSSFGAVALLTAGVAAATFITTGDRLVGVVWAGLAAVWLARLAADQRRATAWRRVDRSMLPATLPVDLDWRPSDDGGCLAWILVDDDRYQGLEAPIVGLRPTSIEVFPTTAEIDGVLAPGGMITARLADGTTLATTKPLIARPIGTTPPRPHPPSDTPPSDR